MGLVAGVNQCECICISAAQCESDYRPDFYGSCGKLQSQQWVMDGHVCCCGSKTSLLLSFFATTGNREELPRLLFNVAKFINWKVVEQTTNQQAPTSIKVLLAALVLDFPKAKLTKLLLEMKLVAFALVLLPHICFEHLKCVAQSSTTVFLPKRLHWPYH